MKEFKKLTNDNCPPHNSVVTLSDGIREIQAEFYNENGEMSFKWIPKHYQKGICMMTNPTHWK